MTTFLRLLVPAWRLRASYRIWVILSGMLAALLWLTLYADSQPPVDRAERLSFNLLHTAMGVAFVGAVALWGDLRWGMGLLAVAAFIIPAVQTFDQTPVGLQGVLLAETACFPLLVLTFLRQSYLDSRSTRHDAKRKRWARGVFYSGCACMVLTVTVFRDAVPYDPVSMGVFMAGLGLSGLGMVSIIVLKITGMRHQQRERQRAERREYGDR